MQLPRVAASPIQSRSKQRRRLSIMQELIIESRRAGTVPLKSVHGSCRSHQQGLQISTLVRYCCDREDQSQGSTMHDLERFRSPETRNLKMLSSVLPAGDAGVIEWSRLTSCTHAPASASSFDISSPLFSPSSRRHNCEYTGQISDHHGPQDWTGPFSVGVNVSSACIISLPT